MTQEEKEILLQDLCARLPYGVKVIHKDHTGRKNIITTLVGYNGHYVETFVCDLCYHLELYDFKPYYRPLSSITEDEANELDVISDGRLIGRCEYLGVLSQHFWTDSFKYILLGIDWLNAHHFDYRGLINKGLALEAPEGMYK